MSHSNVFDLTTIGHFAIDTILSLKMKRPEDTLGGPPAYVSVAAVKLGVKASVISKVGGDFHNKYLKFLQNNNVDLSGLKRVSNASTTHYVLKYRNWERKLRLQAQAPPITPADIPRSLSSAIIHVAPIANEISSEIITKLRKSAKILSLDPQGFVRSFDERGNVDLKQWRDPEVLAQIDIFKSTINEIQAITEALDLNSAMKRISDYGIKIVIVTRGMEGSKLLFDNQSYDIPSCKSKVVADPTGAGDAYIGGFLAEYRRVKDALWCASVGSASASFVVESIGPTRFGEKDEVYERAQRIYDKAAGTTK